MTKVAVVTDSTAYIPADLIEGYPLHVAPLQVIWDGESYRDGIDILPADFYTRLAKSKTMPTTSQTTPAQFLAIYQKLVDEGFDIVSIHISGALSGTLDSAVQAKAHFNDHRIELVDSRTSGMALGFVALTAARAAANGANIDEVKQIAEKAVAQADVLFTVNTFEFLHRGGRIGGASAFIGNLLDVKPILGLQDGKLAAVDKTRTRAKALERMLDIMQERIGDERPVRISILHANVPDQAEALLQKVCQRFNPGDVIEAFTTDVSPTIGTHIGPGALAVSWIAGM